MSNPDSETKKRKPRVIRLPGFIVQEETGLGDVVTGLTYRMGIPPCTGCGRRADALNGFIVFSPKTTFGKQEGE